MNLYVSTISVSLIDAVLKFLLKQKFQTIII